MPVCTAVCAWFFVWPAEDLSGIVIRRPSEGFWRPRFLLHDFAHFQTMMTTRMSAMMTVMFMIVDYSTHNTMMLL